MYSNKDFMKLDKFNNIDITYYESNACILSSAESCTIRVHGSEMSFWKSDLAVEKKILGMNNTIEAMQVQRLVQKDSKVDAT